MTRPYNHADNLDQNGQPKHSEESWALMESLRTGDHYVNAELMADIPGRHPRTLNEEMVYLKRRIKALETAMEKDTFDLSRPAEAKDLAFAPSNVFLANGMIKTVAQALDLLLSKAAALVSSISYTGDMLKWKTAPKNVEQALDYTRDDVYNLETATNCAALADASWSGTKPATVSEAIDRMAVHVKNGSTGPIA